MYALLQNSPKDSAVRRPVDLRRAAPPLAFAPVPALPLFLLSQSEGCLSAESTGVQARKRGGKGAVFASSVTQ